jgi:hypothetical protein
MGHCNNLTLKLERNMPGWLLTALPYILKAPTIALGILHLSKAIADEIASADNTSVKAEKVIKEVEVHADEVAAAVTANTPHS